MKKYFKKPGNFLYPLPCVLVSVRGNNEDNLFTAAWTGTICSDPPMVYISVRPERYSHHMIEETGEFVLNLLSAENTRELDICGVKSGRDLDKWTLTGFTRQESKNVKCPSVAEAPVSIECRVREKLSLGSHDMFISEVVAVGVDEKYFKGETVDLKEAGLISYSHGRYETGGKTTGSFGFSVLKKQKIQKPKIKNKTEKEAERRQNPKSR